MTVTEIKVEVVERHGKMRLCRIVEVDSVKVVNKLHEINFKETSRKTLRFELRGGRFGPAKVNEQRLNKRVKAHWAGYIYNSKSGRRRQIH